MCNERDSFSTFALAETVPLKAEAWPRPKGDHEAGHTGPRRASPRAYTKIEGASSDDGGSDGRVHLQAFAAIPIGSASRTFGPAVNPTRDTKTSQTTLAIFFLLPTP